MPKIPYPDASIEESEWIVKLRDDRRGLLGNLFRMLAHNPEGSYVVSHVGAFLRTGTKLDRRLRELAILAVGKVNGCEYEWSHHVYRARSVGVSNETMLAIGRGDADALEGIDKAIVQYSLQISESSRVDDAVLSTLQEHLSLHQIIDLAITVGYYNMTARVLVPFQVDLDEGVTPLQVGEV